MSASEEFIVLNFSEKENYDNIGLSHDTLKGLEGSGIKLSSPNFLNTIIPLGLNGFDLAVCGKPTVDTRVASSLIALETFLITNRSSRAIILCEDSDSTASVKSLNESVGKYVTDWRVERVNEDHDKDDISKASVLVGTPLLIKSSIISRNLEANSVQLLIIDEGAQTASPENQEVIKEILSQLCSNIQVIFCSNVHDKSLINFLTDKTLFVPITDEVFVLTYKQFFILCQSPPLRALQMKAKSDQLLKIFENISFDRCIVFSNYQSRVKSLSSIAYEKGYKSVAVPDKPVQSKKSKKSHVAEKPTSNFNVSQYDIVFATDDTASNISVDKFDLVINYDIPTDGVKFIRRLNWLAKDAAVCINLSTDDNDLKQLQTILCSICGPKVYLPKLIDPPTTIFDLLSDNLQCTEKVLCMRDFCVDLSIRNEVLKLKKVLNGTSLDQKTDEKGTSNVDSCIMDILNETSNEVKELREQLSDMSTDSIFQCLASGNFPFNANGLKEAESNKDLSEQNKKRKNSDSKSLFEVITSSRNNCLKDADDTPQAVEIDSEERKQDEIFYRNKALLDVTKIVCSKDMACINLDDCDENSIITHLNMLKDQEQEQVSHAHIESVNDILRNIKESENMNNGEITQTDEETGSDKIQLEEIFNFGFKSIIIGDNTRWKMQLAKFKPDENSKISRNTDDEQVEEGEQILGENIDIDESGDDNVMKWVPESSHYQNSSKKENEVEIMKWVPVEQPSKANEENRSAQIEMNHNRIELLKNSNTMLELGSGDPNSAMYREYERYYNSCSDNLWQNALTFRDVDSFDEWFYCNWEVQLSSIRSYVEQNVYVQEMSRYQNSRNNDS